jgi:hypothetical protein
MADDTPRTRITAATLIQGARADIRSRRHYRRCPLTMTPHRHWVRNYTPLCIPIKLADNTIIYSAGVGTVMFNPVIRGRPSRAVEFTRVLHVPQLQNNLLSCLYLTHHKGYEIHISSNSMDFLLSRKTIFTASINSNNAAYLDGVTEPILEFANISSTIPLDLNLWHC